MIAFPYSCELFHLNLQVMLKYVGEKIQKMYLPGGESNPGPLRFLDDKQR